MAEYRYRDVERDLKKASFGGAAAASFGGAAGDAGRSHPVGGAAADAGRSDPDYPAVATRASLTRRAVVLTGVRDTCRTSGLWRTGNCVACASFAAVVRLRSAPVVCLFEQGWMAQIEERMSCARRGRLTTRKLGSLASLARMNSVACR